MSDLLGGAPYLITDGAMGTYFSQLSGEESGSVERANLERPDLIQRIHKEYVDAGAQLLRTNTFGANSASLNAPREEVASLLRAGVRLAREVATNRNVRVAASLGPVPETTLDGHSVNVEDEYRFLLETLLAEGVDHFVFETFSGLEALRGATSFLRARCPDAFILAQFATTPEGQSRRGVPVKRLLEDARLLGTLDAWGLNCGAGPTHMLRIIQGLGSEGLLSIMPNAGYPEVVNERTVYHPNPAYFADRLREIHRAGARILGGCCGSTPAHIEALCRSLGSAPLAPQIQTSGPSPRTAQAPAPNPFADKLRRGDFVVAVELDPPFDTDTTKLIEGARRCKEAGVDLITIADSPMARARVDSLVMAAKIQRETGIPAMPHVCCRDKNLNALKSGFLAGHIEGLRNLLVVTGDALPPGDRAEIKGVFNVNSFRLIEFLAEMNQEPFQGDPFLIGGAFNVNATNRDVEAARMATKAARGATFFLTQPIYTQEVIDYLAAMPRPEGVKILGGILPLVSYRNAQFLNNEMPGIQVPQEAIDRFRPDMPKEEAEAVGIELARDLARRLKPHVDGFYIMTPFNRVGMVEGILAVHPTKGMNGLDG